MGHGASLSIDCVETYAFFLETFVVFDAEVLKTFALGMLVAPIGKAQLPRLCMIPENLVFHDEAKFLILQAANLTEIFWRIYFHRMHRQ